MQLSMDELLLLPDETLRNTEMDARRGPVQGALNSITRASDVPLLNVTHKLEDEPRARERERERDIEKLPWKAKARKEGAEDTGCTHGQGVEKEREEETRIVHHLNCEYNESGIEN